MSGERFYITTAIDYANGDPHLGHALEKIGADAVARYHRMIGRDVHFMIGMDEHGQKVATSAAAAGTTPREFVDRIAVRFSDTWAALSISHDEFIRTTATEHHAAVRELIEMIFARSPDAFYERPYAGLYCVGCEAFKAESDIVDGRCALHTTRVLETVEERNWFFRLSAWADALRELLTREPAFLQPESRRNEMLRVLDDGLEDISASRGRFSWGVPFPRPLSTGEPQTTYVWFDALPNYWTATRRTSARAQWPAQVHVIGKDITRFHAIIWPAMLSAAGLPLPERVWAHGFVSLGGERFSKSAGVTLALDDAIARFGPDALRYYLLRDVPFDADGSFSWERFGEVYEADLANTLGNLASRATAMVEKYFGGEVPAAAADGPVDRVHAAVRQAVDAVAGGKGFLTHEAVAAVMASVRDTNEFVQRAQPWALAKDPSRRGELAEALGAIIRCLAYQAAALAPVIPGKSQELWHSLGGGGNVGHQRLDRIVDLDLSGWRVSKGAPLFPKPEIPSVT